MNISNHLNLLGLSVKDRVTGFTGIVTSISFDLYGCIQAIVHPGIDKEAKLGDQVWFDVARLEVISLFPVMKRPDFEFGQAANGEKGPAEKPSFNKN
jgi:hypothetical protein